LDLCLYMLLGFNVETVEYKNISFTVWDVGGQDKVIHICLIYFIIFQLFFFFFVILVWRGLYDLIVLCGRLDCRTWCRSVCIGKSIDLHFVNVMIMLGLCDLPTLRCKTMVDVNGFAFYLPGFYLSIVQMAFWIGCNDDDQCLSLMCVFIQGLVDK
jgi:hypothetical protein